MEEPKNKPYVSFRASVDIAMGFLYMFISFYCMSLTMIIEEYGKATVYTLGVLFILYGLFRLYRGLIKLKELFIKPTRSRSNYRKDNS